MGLFACWYFVLFVVMYLCCWCTLGDLFFALLLWVYWYVVYCKLNWLLCLWCWRCLHCLYYVGFSVVAILVEFGYWLLYVVFDDLVLVVDASWLLLCLITYKVWRLGFGDVGLVVLLGRVGFVGGNLLCMVVGCCWWIALRTLDCKFIAMDFVCLPVVWLLIVDVVSVIDVWCGCVY